MSYIFVYDLCLLFSKLSKRDGKLIGIDLLNEIKCILCPRFLNNTKEVNWVLT